MPRIADVVTQTFRSISPDAISERLFRDPLEFWWSNYQARLAATGYEGTVQSAFFIATFATMGHLAKCDGRVKDIEIEMASRVMDHLNLTADQKRLAIRLFNDGKHSDFALDTLIWRFNRVCHHRVSVLQVFIEIQLQMAYADLELSDRESRLIKRMCKRLHVSDSIYTRIERRVRAEVKGLSGETGESTTRPKSLADAYRTLGISRFSTSQQIKQAYRRLMSLNHPDKLMARGAGEGEILEAQGLVQNVKTAYELLVKTRKLA